MERVAWYLTALLILVAFMASCEGPGILYSYNDPFYRRGSPHFGVDFGGRFEAPVLAAADGEVLGVYNYGEIGCGINITLVHKPFEYYTRYCHLSKALVQEGQMVKRGEVIGLMGSTGDAGRTVHVHFELCPIPCLGPDPDLLWHRDPREITVGCFDARRKYPTDRLVLTYPVECKD